ncbi:MAG TPA: thymidine phosphorylase [Candidatus Binatia bacterium]|nr:thymidine phosphorylase [Candidatus Binatia bacterium]
MRDVIAAKRDGRPLSEAQIRAWIRGVADGSIPDYQSAALLMAIVWRGMSREETVALTDALMRSGRVLDWSGLGRPTVDKHSTGGVGDKVSIALAPWVAACGAVVPMIAGRGLGHTGGTLDKLEAIPGFRTRLSAAEFEGQVRKIGLAIAGQGEDLAPADGALYALRDVTGTVESVPLIVASILSKKAASGAAGVVFDVKCGAGAFMPGREEASGLARELVSVLSGMGRKAHALVTAMDEPLGAAVGNANETAEAFAVLHRAAPSDLMEVTRALAVRMLVLGGVARERHEAEARLDRALETGEALRRAERMVQAQGGDPRVVGDPGRLPRAEAETAVPAPRSGYVAAVDARRVGELVIAMGGGRRRKEDAVDPAVGVRLLKKRGDRVDAGEALALVQSRREALEWTEAAARAYVIADEPPSVSPLVLEEVAP